jgi:hypothetical protein
MLTLVRQLVELEKRRRDYCSVLLSGGELLFCAHHGRKFEPELKKIAAEIQDETERLTAVPASVSEEER